MPNSVPRARRWARRVFCRAGADDDFIDVGLLLVSEVVTNAVIHGLGDELTVTVNPDLSVVVWDASEEMPQRRVAGPTETGGRGLELLEALAPGYRVCPGPSGGKAVHFAPKGWCGGLREDESARSPASAAEPALAAVQVWCHWHDGRTDTGLLIVVEEQASGPGASLYACAACREEHGLVPWQGWDG